MFYSVFVCPACDAVDVFPDDEMELSSNLECEALCQQCQFDQSGLAQECAIELEGEHNAHILDYMAIMPL